MGKIRISLSLALGFPTRDTPHFRGTKNQAQKSGGRVRSMVRMEEINCPTYTNTRLVSQSDVTCNPLAKYG